jgi:mRNA interferase RelE/StbE
LRFDEGAERELAALDRAMARRIGEKLTWLSENADEVRHLPLRFALSGSYKLRVGDWRVIYRLLEPERVVFVVALGHRSEAYEE